MPWGVSSFQVHPSACVARLRALSTLCTSCSMTFCPRPMFPQGLHDLGCRQCPRLAREEFGGQWPRKREDRCPAHRASCTVPPPWQLPTGHPGRSSRSSRFILPPCTSRTEDGCQFGPGLGGNLHLIRQGFVPETPRARVGDIGWPGYPAIFAPSSSSGIGRHRNHFPPLAVTGWAWRRF